MTYDELAALLGSDPHTARQASFQMALDHRHSHDGLTRVRLNRELQARFILGILEDGSLLRAASAELKDLHARIARTSPMIHEPSAWRGASTDR